MFTPPVCEGGKPASFPIIVEDLNLQQINIIKDVKGDNSEPYIKPRYRMSNAKRIFKIFKEFM